MRAAVPVPEQRAERLSQMTFMGTNFSCEKTEPPSSVESILLEICDDQRELELCLDAIHDMVQQGQKPPKRLHSITETAELLNFSLTSLRLFINAK